MFPPKSKFWDAVGQINWWPDAGNPTWSDTSSNLADWYRPKYGDTLRYCIAATRPMWVEVWLNCSTYKGRAMNAPVPMGRDSISDVVNVSTGWDTVAFAYIGERSCLKLKRRIQPSHPWYPWTVQKIAFVVQDYAAEAEISIHPIGMGCVILDPTQHIPANLPYYVGTTDSMKATDPDSDGFTRWEEYRGFCNDDYNDPHIRLDNDTTFAQRQILVIDEDAVFEANGFDDLHSRLQQMTGCNLVIQNQLLTNQTEGPFPTTTLDIWERVDTYQAKWSSSYAGWVANELTNPAYAISSPIPYLNFERPIEQVALRLSSQPSIGGSGECYHLFGGPDWGYGICGNSGIAYDFNAAHDYMLAIWPLFSVHNTLFNDVNDVCDPRTIAHEFGHAINVDDHIPQYSGNNLMCVMLNARTWANQYFDRNMSEYMAYSWWENTFIHGFEDHPGSQNHQWGYFDDGNDNTCHTDIRYRPPFPSP